MLSTLNDDNLYHILLHFKSINSLNNHLHISKHIYNLIINDYNKLYTFILLIKRWRKFSTECKLLNNIKYILYHNHIICDNIYHHLICDSIKTFIRSLYYMNYKPNWYEIIYHTFRFTSLKFSKQELKLIQQEYKLKSILYCYRN